MVPNRNDDGGRCMVLPPADGGSGGRIIPWVGVIFVVVVVVVLLCVDAMTAAGFNVDVGSGDEFG